jgi:uncharacterized protein YbaP (TraB family)
MKTLLVWLGLVTSCSAPSKRCTIDVPRPADPAPFLWRAAKDGVVVWLYGTIHNGEARDVPAVAWSALGAAPRFASELGDSEPDGDRLGELARIQSGKTLDFLLPPDDWYELRDALRGTVKEDDLRRYRPWYAMARLTAKLAPSPTPTMDFALAERAKEARKPVDALETWAEQLETLADSVGAEDLRDAIRARHRMRCELRGMLAFYAAGDLPAMQKWLAMPKSGQLLGARNRKWLAKIESYFASGGAFVAVGLGHLIGADSLPSLLVERGYVVERVVSSRESTTSRASRSLAPVPPRRSPGACRPSPAPAAAARG